MARTADELLEEEEGEEEVEEEESEDEETVPYNPKNLPLGWDGKVVGRNLRREGERERRGKDREGTKEEEEEEEEEKVFILITHSHTHSQPIPYWLYKLHGLNITYSCEICGNATYRGPKAFQRHFSVSETSH